MGGLQVQKCPSFWLFLFCNPSYNCKHASNLNAKGVNLNVIIKAEYSIIFLHSVRNFAFMSDFGKLKRQNFGHVRKVRRTSGQSDTPRHTEPPYPPTSLKIILANLKNNLQSWEHASKNKSKH